MKCDNCTEKCPQEELACEIAKGRMYATNEVVRLQKELKEIKAKAIDEFVANAERWNNNIKSIRNEEAFFTIEDIRKVAEQMKGE